MNGKKSLHPALPRAVRFPGSGLIFTALLSVCWLPATSALASTAYGTLNNFDCVNDTGQEAHGFEIELEDVHSRDLTYTYDYNHYGIPKIWEDSSDPPASQGHRALCGQSEP